ncbi:laccase-15-like [Panicum miliaceum]|uniref:Laccase-15-like n=1 Tax=Panicum miliaceum TaxID=4540 RepID=A0A3L6PYQ9_PANMI|nr:laccase-15-like [Panicum miliaceum]
MDSRSLHGAVAAVFFLLLSMALLAAAGAATVEHTFVVSQVRMTNLCKETLVTAVNGQLPGPAIEVTEGDSVAVQVINKSPYNITIHWHGVKQRLNCWADGVPMITQCPIQPGHNFTYRFNVVGQEDTLWWHAHVSCLRASVHGPLIIRPRQGASSYPFPKPHTEVPIIIGEWWETNLIQVARNLTHGFFGFNPSAATLNGKLGDLYNCSGAMQEGFMLDVERGKTYLLRFINAALMSEYYVKIAGHKFTWFPLMQTTSTHTPRTSSPSHPVRRWTPCWSPTRLHGDEDETDSDLELELDHDKYVSNTSEITVYEVEPASKKIEKISSLGQNVLFLGHNQSLCLHAEEYPQLKANHVYLTDDDFLYTTGFKNNRRDIGVFDLENNSSEEITTPQLWSNWPTPVWLIPNPRKMSLATHS